jgi:hypothetical protein
MGLSLAVSSCVGPFWNRFEDVSGCFEIYQGVLGLFLAVLGVLQSHSGPFCSIYRSFRVYSRLYQVILKPFEAVFGLFGHFYFVAVTGCFGTFQGLRQFWDRLVAVSDHFGAVSSCFVVLSGRFESALSYLGMHWSFFRVI